MADIWNELRLEVIVPEAMRTSSDRTELWLTPLAECALALSPGGFVQEGEDAPPGDLAKPRVGQVRFRVYTLAGETEAAQARFESVAASLDAPYTLAAIPLDPSWKGRWKEWFHAFTVGDRIAVRPPWEPALEDPSGRRIDIVIEPGMAFGTGQHATTRLCLGQLGDLADENRLPARILDVGTGTGILAIAAAKLGAAHIRGVDVDPIAIRLAKATAEINGVGGLLELDTTDCGDIEADYPLVIANILGHILLALAESLAARVAPGGELWLCGLNHEQAPGLIERFEGLGLRVAKRAAIDSWVFLVLR